MKILKLNYLRLLILPLLIGLTGFLSNLILPQAHLTYYLNLPSNQLVPLTNANMHTIVLAQERSRLSPGSYQFWIYIMISVGLTLTAGLMSGLTVGYLSIDKLAMQLKMETGTEQEKKDAAKVLPILQKHHLLLVTLLLCNAAAMEALPIFLDSLVPAVVAIVISVTAVLFFGQIIPQAVCTGPNQIRIAAAVSPLTLTLMYASSPLSYPISLLLDVILGKHEKARFLNTDLKALIDLHQRTSLQSLGTYQEKSKSRQIGLDSNQTEMIKGAIEAKEREAGQKMIPFDQVQKLSLESKVDEELFDHLRTVGYSRMPIYRGNRKQDIVGILLMKKLVGVKAGIKVKDLDTHLKKPLVIDPDTTYEQIMGDCLKGSSHLALITNNCKAVQARIDFFFERLAGRSLHEVSDSLEELELEQLFKGQEDDAQILGIITLEDVLEGVLRQNIKDEADIERQRAIEMKQLSPLKETLSLTFIQDYKEELSTLLDKSRGRTNKLIGRTPLGQIQKKTDPTYKIQRTQSVVSTMTQIRPSVSGRLQAGPLQPFRSPAPQRMKI